MPINISNKKILVVAFIALLLVGSITFLVVTRYLSLAPKQPLTEPTEVERQVVPSPILTPEREEIPTLTPERKEIISKIETHTVTIQNRTFSPASLTIKLHDQVEWQNKDSETYKIKGEDWGNVPIEPGESFSQAFETAGTYSYSCALHPEMTGTIVVE